jgi:hypothetical protein
MNLQICVPYEECPFRCPMCIAKNRKIFNNLYKENPTEYFNRLQKVVPLYDYFILTGSTEPTLNSLWLKDVSHLLQWNGSHVELQTRNYNLKNYDLSGIETVAYSISTMKNYLKSWNFRKSAKYNRLVILLTKEFDILNVNLFNPMGYNQITFKKLQPTSDAKANEWIKNNEMVNFDSILDLVNFYNGSDISVRFDGNCQDSHGRYEIFREDGEIYKAWEEE